MNNYIPYHVHSDYSLQDSCTKFKEYVDLAVANSQKAIASTEHGKPLGWVSKKLYCEEKGIKFIHGVEIYLTERLFTENGDRVRDNYHTVLLARNLDGVRELNALVHKSCDKDHFYYTNRISFDEFLSISPNIISTSACLASPLNKLPDDHPRYMELARKYDFLEVQAHDHPEQITFNRRLLALSMEIGTPLIAGTDTHSSSSYKAECRRILLSAKRTSYGDEDNFDLTYKTYDELVDMFRQQGALDEEVFMEAIANTNRLDDMVEDFKLDTSIKYPILYGSQEEDERQFAKRVERMFADKVERGVIPPEQVNAFRSAIDEEMDVFHRIGMMGFMGSMSELICWCKEQGMAIGTARGSVGGSRVAYVTDIIDMNPETWHTAFSRFANVDRVEIGDIDIDVVKSDRPAIFEYITDRFGTDKTARVASFGTIKGRGVIDDVGRHLSIQWVKEHGEIVDNPWSLDKISQIKKEFSADVQTLMDKYEMTEDDVYKKHLDEVVELPTTKKYPELFYYVKGMFGVKVSQSVHPAGMVISPITLVDNYGVFEKDGENCLFLDMDEAHEAGLAKYDFLVLKTVQVIRDACRYMGRSYPQTNEINWNDEDVWADMIKSSAGLFQFESGFAFDSLKKFVPHSIFDMSLVTACIRPSGASYRNELLARKPHSNPSELIDDLLKDNLGYLVYQEDIIQFLQKICGLSGSQADSVRRGIAKKRMELLDEWMPVILDGYCNKSSKDRGVAEQEAKEFLKIIQDASAYMFGYNHSVAYCLLGYLCAYYRYYNPIEFITSFLNNAANDDDIQNGTALAKQRGIKIIQPKYGYSKADYFFDKEANIISKGVSSVKYMSRAAVDELYELSKTRKYDFFIDLLKDISEHTSLDSRQLDILIKIDFFAQFGNQRELFKIVEMFELFKKGSAKKIRKDAIDGTWLEKIVCKSANGKTKSGDDAKSYTITDMDEILHDIEFYIKGSHVNDLSVFMKAKNFIDIMGYAGYTSGKEEDRNKLLITGVFPVRRKKDNEVFGYSVLTQSIGSGIESRMTVFKRRFDQDPIKKGDIIVCRRWERDKIYFRMLDYEHLLY